MGTSARISLQDAGVILGYSSLRSVRRWCKLQGLEIFSYPKSRKKFVLKPEFETALLQIAIPHLKSRYGESGWQAVMEALITHDEIAIVRLANNKDIQNSVTLPRGHHAATFLSELTAALNDAV